MTSTNQGEGHEEALVYSNVPLPLLRLANDVETNPVDQHSGPRPLPVFTVCAKLHTNRSLPHVQYNISL